jgi:hypothetical protein
MTKSPAHWERPGFDPKTPVTREQGARNYEARNLPQSPGPPMSTDKRALDAEFHKRLTAWCRDSGIAQKEYTGGARVGLRSRLSWRR